MSAAIDATTVSLSELSDPDKYFCKESVPIFMAHVRHKRGSDGKIYKVEVTDDDLDEIALNMKRLLDENNTPVRIVDGHIIPDPAVPESLQPPLLGFGINPRRGVFGPKKIPCVLVDNCIKRGQPHEVAKQRPFCSAEYYPNAKLIKGVALMVRDPELNLGFVSYTTDENGRLGPCVYYGMEYSLESGAASGANGATGATMEDDIKPEEQESYNAFCRYFGHAMKKYGVTCADPAAGPSAPSGTNTTIPGEIKKKKSDEERETMDANASKDIPELYAKIEKLELEGKTRDEAAKKITETLAAEKKALADDLAKLQTNYAAMMQQTETDKCAAIVRGLMVDYKLDEKVEIGNLLTKTTAEREAHIAYIKATHAPQDQQIQVYRGDSEGGVATNTGRETSEDMSRMAVNYAAEHKMDYDAAIKEVKAGKRPTKMPMKIDRKVPDLRDMQRAAQ